MTLNDDDSYITTAQWQALGYDQHSFTATQSALFVDWATGNYQPVAGSALIDAGMAELAGDPAPTTDILGNVRPFGNGYDIGCYEYGSSPAQPPSVATPASASPATVIGTTTQLSVLGADAQGEASLSYTWSTAGTPPAPVTFSANGSNAAKAVTATFAASGSYTLQVTISNAQGLTVSSTVSVSVAATASSLRLSPLVATVAPKATQPFTAIVRDQFGVALTTQPAITWKVNGGGSISTQGLFTAGSSGGVAIVTAGADGLMGRARVIVANKRMKDEG